RRPRRQKHCCIPRSARAPPLAGSSRGRRGTPSHTTDRSRSRRRPPFPTLLQVVGVVTAVDNEHRPRLRLRIALHLGRKLTHLGWMRKTPVLVRHDADRERHERHPMQLPASILAEVVPGPAVLLVVL